MLKTYGKKMKIARKKKVRVLNDLFHNHNRDISHYI